MILRLIAMLIFVIVALAVGTVIFISTTDFTQYARDIEKQLEAATGREIKITGKIDVRLLRFPPSLSVQSVSISNASWGSRPHMATVRRVYLRMRILPLLSRKIHIREIELIEPDILLEIDSRGRSNWAFDSERGRSYSPPDIWVGALNIVGGRITYRPAGVAKGHQLEIIRLRADTPSINGALNVSAAGKLGGKNFILRGQLDTLGAAVKGQPVKVSFEASVGASDLAGQLTLNQGKSVTVTGHLISSRLTIGGGTTTTTSGAFDTATLPVESLRAIAADLTVAIGSLSVSGIIFKDVSAHLRAGQGKLAIDTVKATFVGGRLEGSLTIDAEQSPAQLGLDLILKSGRFASLLYRRPPPGAPSGRIDVKIKAMAKGATVAAMTKSINGRATAIITGLGIGHAQGPGTRLVRVAHIAAEAELPALMRGNIRLKYVRAKGVEVALVKDARGRRNWAQRAADDTSLIEILRLARRWEVAGRVTYRDLGTGITHIARIGHLNLMATGSSAVWRINASGAFDLLPVRISCRLCMLGPMLRGRPGRAVFTAALGENQLSGDLTLHFTDRPRMTGRVWSRLLAIGTPGVKGKPTARKAQHRIFGTKPLPLALLHALQGQVRYDVNLLRLNRLTINQARGTIRIDDGRASVLSMRGVLSGGDLTLNLTADPMPKRPRFKLIAELLRAKVKVIVGSKGPPGLLDARVNLSGAGGSMREIASSLTGSIKIFVHGRKLAPKSGLIANAGFGFLGTLASAGSMRGGDLNCIAAHIRFKEGQGYSDRITIDTASITFVGQGRVDLIKETVDFVIVPRNKIALVRNVAFFAIRLRGPINNPSQSLDLGQAAIITSKQLIRAGLLPARIVGWLTGAVKEPWERFNPCPKLAEKGGTVATGKHKSQPIQSTGQKRRGLFPKLPHLLGVD
ncbi:MAG: AsmA family protein [Alphaproteobacteria bacterium]|nr:AsmA family protein [Alphaproteobacteria bacterium]